MVGLHNKMRTRSQVIYLAYTVFDIAAEDRVRLTADEPAKLVLLCQLSHAYAFAHNDLCTAKHLFSFSSFIPLLIDTSNSSATLQTKHPGILEGIF